MSTATIPNPITAEADIESAPLAANFAALASFLNTKVLHADGSKALSGELQLVDGNNAASTQQVADAVSDAVPVGTITAYAGTTVPNSQWQFCDGVAISKTTFAALYAAIGNTYGEDTLTFNKPNLKGRVVVGVDGADGDFDTVGEGGGSKDAVVVTHKHTMPSHKHSVNPASRLATWARQLYEYAYPRATSGLAAANTKWIVADSTASTETAPSVNIPATDTTNVDPGDTNDAGVAATGKNLQPYRALHYIIKVA